jgi:hypothetical protein
MCESNNFFYLPLALLFVSAAGALRAGEPEPAACMPMYLISETELLSIERYKEKSEAEKRRWLSQAGELKAQAGELKAQADGLKAQADGLRADSAILSDQLAQARERNRRLERLYDESEAGRLTLLSLKNGEIADLKREAAGKALEAEACKGVSRSRLFVIVALAGSWIVFTAFKACRFFRLF